MSLNAFEMKGELERGHIFKGQFFTHTFNKCLLSTCYVSGSASGTEERAPHKTDKKSSLMPFSDLNLHYSLGRYTVN